MPNAFGRAPSNWLQDFLCLGVVAGDPFLTGGVALSGELPHPPLVGYCCLVALVVAAGDRWLPSHHSLVERCF